ncbi:hypothetical protein [Candidatus Spongiihabitans sp.]|uniref:hypothetical protein n=1 Tax=Candidatus Spongiihabitans sp. TaxID=3101308 RepID=UPI003C705EB0
MKFSKIGAVVIGLLFSGGVYAECVSDVNKGGNLPRKSNPSIGYRYGEQHGHWVERYAGGGWGEGPMVDGKANGDIWLDIDYDNGKIIGTDIITD